MFRFIGEYAVFALLGVAIGKGPYDLSNWQWWAWLFVLVAAVQVHAAMVRK